MPPDGTSAANVAPIVEIELALGIRVEEAVQSALGADVAGLSLSAVYVLVEPVVIPAALVWVHRRNRGVYRVLRDTVLASWLIALPIYALLPTAPPRLTGLGITDTVSALTPVALSAPSTTAFFNPCAAIPSLHAGCAVAIGVAVAAAMHPRRRRRGPHPVREPVTSRS